jgi:hypothetical protein
LDRFVPGVRGVVWLWPITPLNLQPSDFVHLRKLDAHCVLCRARRARVSLIGMCHVCWALGPCRVAGVTTVFYQRLPYRPEREDLRIEARVPCVCGATVELRPRLRPGDTESMTCPGCARQCTAELRAVEGSPRELHLHLYHTE